MTIRQTGNGPKPSIRPPRGKTGELRGGGSQDFGDDLALTSDSDSQGRDPRLSRTPLSRSV